MLVKLYFEFSSMPVVNLEHDQYIYLMNVELVLGNIMYEV